MFDFEFDFEKETTSCIYESDAARYYYDRFQIALDHAQMTDETKNSLHGVFQEFCREYARKDKNYRGTLAYIRQKYGFEEGLEAMLAGTEWDEFYQDDPGYDKSATNNVIKISNYRNRATNCEEDE